ncbi:AlwI family type II restriction endonuclease [Arcobacter sp. CECT 9188]|uniref:AlwI family type II restriction endonuclease n=1 Tax=Arcobacter sp. CECT 9188 TaxID=2044505 RepID=UPI000DEAA557|nr:AlwI family type II restriction endonuclease [Arcobacter sp. CECT 9188]RBQ26350.1 AlwI family restriction endonuclease [Arcobacter sp. CECT 9188]
MAQKNRDKEFWLIPKRANLHQSILLTKGIIDLNYDLKTWNGAKQDRLGSYLGKNGATNNGKNITPQAVRTLLASIPQYLGFLYINSNTTPNTLVVTDAGKKLVDFHKNDFKTMKNLKEGEDNGDTISESEFYLKQFEKLQITNPIILKDCESIFTFPLVASYKLLLELIYLDIEEISYILFKVKDETEINLAKVEIENFRKIDINDRNSIIESFKKTHLGNISLVQAPTSSYFIKLLMQTGIFEENRIVLPNPNNTDVITKKAIIIKPNKIDYVKKIVKEFNLSNTYDFENNLNLWIDYIGDVTIDSVPHNIKFINNSKVEYILNIEYKNRIIFSDLIKITSSTIIPMFKNKNYKITCIDLLSGNILKDEEITITDKIYNHLELNYTLDGNSNKLEETVETISKDIIEHNKSQNFDKDFLKYLSVLESITGRNLTTNKNLRGARLELLFYKLLTCLKESDIIDDIYWNGKISQYGLPVPAPGGKTGIPDIVFVIDDVHILLELTTIKSKTMQWSAEGSSVPDHIKYYKEQFKVRTMGIFVAPIHHDRVINGIKSQLLDDDIMMKFLTDEEFLNIFKNSNKNDLKHSLGI